ncbi:GNAT superfamily N-acetyltransferase [Actinoplanes tereljensis]|uniref:N-acetyltransferase domain-containing protein n=1 Tax=Paractinoplanes tereljensis TaxID=571912 RepID=A0A919TWW3_9ACTN|nr:GNAT family N-acetyltransferase [Actinoplanes tereljensis]GIF23660.1 hypothetical protein Ate02nite_63900 [Actinoplanes tereljensis]
MTIEADFMYDYETRMPEAARDRLGVRSARIGRGVALAMVHDPSTYWSKALGFGFDLAPEVLDEVLEFYRESGAERAVIQLTPPFAELARDRGLEHAGTWVKLAGDPAKVAAPATELRIGPVPAGRAREWADLVLGTFGMPAGDLTEMLAGTVGRPGWHPFAAFDGERIVAGANLYVNGSEAALNAAATRPDDRGRGAQSALIAARAAAAAEAGCRQIFAETWKPADGAHNGSLANMLRAGLAPIYERDNWIWRR